MICMHCKGGRKWWEQPNTSTPVSGTFYQTVMIDLVTNRREYTCGGTGTVKEKDSG